MYLMPTFAFKPIFPTDVVTSGSAENCSAEENGVAAEKQSSGSADPSTENGNGSPPEDFVTTLDFRMGADLRDKVNRVLRLFVGSHYFHNYTSGK
jgi:tRNA U38,U39,U40 pseudouridine synthase TruA